MPHKCVRCGTIYPSSSSELLKGCKCGARIFVYLRDEKQALSKADSDALDAATKSPQVVALSKEKPVSIEIDNGSSPVSTSSEDDVREIGDYLTAGNQAGSASHGREQPAENITVIEKGAYELDIPSLMRGDPLVVRSQSGIYYLKIPSYSRKGA